VIRARVVGVITPLNPPRTHEPVDMAADGDFLNLHRVGEIALRAAGPAGEVQQDQPLGAGDAERARDFAANDFKYWALMCHAAQRGIKVFDYGRSKVGTGPYSFKKNWGFEPQPLHYEYRLYKRDGIPQNNPNNPKYKLMIETWRRMPLALANFLGPFIVRNLG